MTRKLSLVALGANLSSSAGLPADTLRMALKMMFDSGLIPRIVSRFWRTPAFPAGSGPDYVNAAAAVATDSSPEQVLAILHEIEAELGRVRDGGRWQARGIDLDLIAIGDMILPHGDEQDRWRALPPDERARVAPDQLILPHPRVQDRSFVLAPLADIAPDWVHPRTGQSVTQMLSALPASSMAGVVPFSHR